jgi:3-methyl-2-oxobutanoate hydroxymethyltransferase
LNQIVTSALKEYHEEVKTRQFPAPQNTYPIDQTQLNKFWEQERERNSHKEEQEKRVVHATM